MFVLHTFSINHVEELEQEYSKYQQCQKKKKINEKTEDYKLAGHCLSFRKNRS